MVNRPSDMTDSAEQQSVPPGQAADRPTPVEMSDPGAHDRGGWLTLAEAARRFDVPAEQLAQALQSGQMAGRRVADETLSPAGAAPESVVPEGSPPPPAARKDDWLVQPDQVERFLAEAAGR